MTTENKKTNDRQAGEIVCPFCSSADNELFSLFGQTLIGSQYYCNHCRTVFEAVRWESKTSEVSSEVIFANLRGLRSDNGL